MHRETVCTLAAELSRSPEAMLEQLQRAGLPHVSTDDPVTVTDKSALLAYLKRSHGQVDDSARKKITLTRRLASETTHFSPAERKAVERIARAKGLTVAPSAQGAFRRYLESVVAALEGHWAEVGEAERPVNEAYRTYLLKLTWKGEHAQRCQSVLALASTSLAKDRWSCARADREACIHPAIAPPQAAI